MVPLYTEVSSLQEVGIEEFHCIQSSTVYSGVSTFQWVGIEEFHYRGVLISGGCNRGVPLQRCPHFSGLE